MEKYAKMITIINNDYTYNFLEKLFELLELIRTRKKYILHPEILEWVKTLKRKDVERFAMDVYNIQLLDIFGELCQIIYSL